MAPTSPSSRPHFLRALSSSSSSAKPTKDKPRLYVALYPRGDSSTASTFRNVSSCDSYHWTLVVGPQTACRTDAGTRYHVAHLDEQSDRYLYEEQDIPLSTGAQRCLVRVAVCKVSDEERLRSILRDMPIRGDDSAFNCLSWVREAFRRLHDDGKAVKTYLKSDDWDHVEKCARKYCKRKRDAGRFQEGAAVNNNGVAPPWDVKQISTFNYWENRETTS
ncbi:hypothetical protein A1O7_09681 [Cladophialophora yegresii CBS 114405]|uniref:Uncharacterized protein n=1 Tax=Cladophialophora yegresii CBS 114405 TaxID=1182544 RepID=W9VFH6_9EURO|nr:uncharacterized protein A1O7_09681 [Cladophialophora yegresii CBS 114405]EXJ54342.1 hypothetical protein A1O7_09681 [Cladophialophora yegresii CBS 114405]